MCTLACTPSRTSPPKATARLRRADETRRARARGEPTPVSERAKLSVLDATLLTAGGIIGVGIFFNPRAGAAAVDGPQAFLGLWLFGGLVALAAAFTFAELGSSFPETGGWFVFLREAFGRFPAFLFAWVVLFVVSTGATAAVALFGASQLQIAFPGWFGADGGVGDKTIAAGLISLLTALGLS
ncbi:MAG TPA: amino acid permease, partial [Planctomycetes bacterium]|nr:amino acid permease [Planctomycetota bacterium]